MITLSFYFGLDYLENDQPHFKVLKHAFFLYWQFSSCDMICFLHLPMISSSLGLV